MIKKNFFLKIYIIFLVCSLMLNAQERIEIDGIVSVIGDNVILKSDLNKYTMQFSSQFDSAINKCNALEELINQKILVHQAKIDSLKTQESSINSEVDFRISTWVSQLGSMSKLESFYGSSEKEIRKEIYYYIEEMMLSNMMKRKIIEDLTITPLEIEKYLEKNRDNIKEIPKQMEISEIVIYPEYSQESKDLIIDKLNSIKEEIKGGSSFKTKAILYSDDKKSSMKGGVYQNVKRGYFDKKFESIAYNLDEGELSDIFETSKGFYLIKLLKRRGEILDLSLIMMKNKLTPDVEEKILSLLEDIKFKIINKEISFEDAVENYSQSKTKDNKGLVITNPKLGKTIFYVKDIENKEYNLYKEIRNLKEKEISDIIKQTKDDKLLYRIVKINKLIEKHKVDYKIDFDMVKNISLQNKQNKKIQEWLKENKSKTYIEIYEDKLKKCL